MFDLDDIMGLDSEVWDSLCGSNAQMDGISALVAAESTAMRKLKGECDTEFVKRIARAYNVLAINSLIRRNQKAKR